MPKKCIPLSSLDRTLIEFALHEEYQKLKKSYGKLKTDFSKKHNQRKRTAIDTLMKKIGE